MQKNKKTHFWNTPAITKLYYMVRPLIPRWVQIMMRRRVIKRALPELASVWPIDETASHPPEGWQGWPQGKKFALILTHDVESAKGVGRCRDLAELEMELGFRSSFNFLLSKYSTPDSLRYYLDQHGFEIGIHGCYHDGKKFKSRKIFDARARIINQYLESWKASGFRAPSMHCNLEWIGDLNIEYDLSTFDTDPFEPHAGGTGTIFPFLVKRSGNGSPFVEMPYTLPQDFTPFVLLDEKTDDIWRKKLDWIVNKGGMALVNVHPDYMAFGHTKPAVDEYPARIYEDFLRYINERYDGQYHHCLPRDLARFYMKACGQEADRTKEGLQP